MSEKYYYFYSEQSEKSMRYLDIVEDSQEGEAVCVDSNKIRKKLIRLGITQVPSIVFAKDKRILQNQDAVDFLKQFIRKPVIQPNIQLPIPTPQYVPPRTPISAIAPVHTSIIRTAEEAEINESVKKAVKENSIMDKVKMLTKEREDVLLDNK